jgi:hypothetical protein
LPPPHPVINPAAIIAGKHFKKREYRNPAAPSCKTISARGPMANFEVPNIMRKPTADQMQITNRCEK